MSFITTNLRRWFWALFLSLSLTLGCALSPVTKKEAALLPQALVADEEPCLEIRLAFDVGSGSTKAKAAEFDRCENQWKATFFEKSEKLSLKEDLKNSSDMFLSDPMVDRLTELLKSLKDQALSAATSIEKTENSDKKLKPIRIKAVGTSALREAKNSPYVANKIKNELGFELKVISQAEEAEIGYASVRAVWPKLKDRYITWDIGGGSQQILYRDGKEQILYQGQLASVSFKNRILSEVKKKDSKEINSPNPMSRQEIQKAISISQKWAVKDVGPSVKALVRQKELQVYGIGGVFAASLSKQVQAKSLTLENLQRTLNKQLGKTDQQIGGDFADTDVTNLALVIGYMQGLGVREVIPVKVSLVDGLILDWNEY